MSIMRRWNIKRSEATTRKTITVATDTTFISTVTAVGRIVWRRVVVVHRKFWSVLQLIEPRTTKSIR